MAGSRIVVALFASAGLLCASCASMIHGSTDEIHIQTGDPKAAIYLNNQQIGMGLADAVVHRNKIYEIEGREAGCQSRYMETGSKFDTADLIPLYFYIVPIIPGFIIDAITGDMWATYPLIYTVTPICPVAPTPNPPAK